MKKRFLAGILAAITLMTSVPVYASENERAVTDRDAFVQTLMNNRGVWELSRYESTPTMGIVEPGYSVIDLNLDGELELIVHYQGGSMANQPAKVYQVSQGKVVQCGDDYYEVAKEIDLYYNKTKKQYVYLQESYLREGARAYYTYYSEIIFKKSGLEYKDRFLEGYTDYNLTGNKTYVYKVNDASVSKSTYQSEYNEYMSNMLDLNLKYKFVSGTDWYKSSTTGKTNYLYALYDGFSYDKFDTSLPFADIFTNKWYYNSVKWAYTNGYLTGTSDNEFSPNGQMTRGMLVTVLYRMEGRPSVKGGKKFSDVSNQKYYANAIAWAAAEKIVSGYNNGKFGPEDNITREQIAKILYLYAKSKGYDVSKSSSLSGFSDASDISSFAKNYMQWAVAEGLIKGSNGKLNPKDNATRAEISAILKRFVENAKVAEKPVVPETKETEGKPETPETKETEGKPETPETKETEGKPETPETKETEGKPETPETKETEEKPEMPETKETEGESESSEPEDTTSSYELYRDVIESTINEISSISSQKHGYGILYDVDENGVKELIMVHVMKNQSSTVMGYSIYTIDGNKLAAVVDSEVLYKPYDDPDGCAAVVEVDGKTYIATTWESGVRKYNYVNRGGDWKLYILDGKTLTLDTVFEYDCYKDTSYLIERIDYNRSSAVLNGVRCGYDDFEEWLDDVKILAVAEDKIDGTYESTTLDELLDQLDEIQ